MEVYGSSEHRCGQYPSNTVVFRFLRALATPRAACVLGVASPATSERALCLAKCKSLLHAIRAETYMYSTFNTEQSCCSSVHLPGSIDDMLSESKDMRTPDSPPATVARINDRVHV